VRETIKVILEAEVKKAQYDQFRDVDIFLKLVNCGLRTLKLDNLMRLGPDLLEISPFIYRMEYNYGCVSRR